jgi:hypothetical protein
MACGHRREGLAGLDAGQDIRRRFLERRALITAGVGAFVCTAGEATAGEVTAAVTALLRKMVNIGVSEPRPFIFTFALAGTIHQLPRRELR